MAPGVAQPRLRVKEGGRATVAERERRRIGEKSGGTFPPPCRLGLGHASEAAFRDRAVAAIKAIGRRGLTANPTDTHPSRPEPSISSHVRPARRQWRLKRSPCWSAGLSQSMRSKIAAATSAAGNSTATGTPTMIRRATSPSGASVSPFPVRVQRRSICGGIEATATRPGNRRGFANNHFVGRQRCAGG